MIKNGIDYDVVCVGSGPASLFAALELVKHISGKRIAIFEKGPKREKRTDDNLISGLGGSGAFSDGKLTLPNRDYPESLNVGGHLQSLIGTGRYLELTERVSDIYSEYGGRANVYEEDDAAIRKLVVRAATFGLRLTPTRVRHFGSDLAPVITDNIAETLRKEGVSIFLETQVVEIKKTGDSFVIYTEGDYGGTVRSRYVIAAPGREGAAWLAKQVSTLSIKIQPRQAGVDIGVRVEVAEEIMSPLTDYLYDPKVEYYPKPFEDKVRTFCVCPKGQVVVEKYHNLLTTVNGHSLYERPLSRNTNFAVLVSAFFTEPFKEPLKYAGRVSELANMLGSNVLVQRLGDLKAGRRSTAERIAKGFTRPSLEEATPGDLGYAIPYRPLHCVLGILEALDNIVPGVNGEHTLLYGNEVKFYSSNVKTSSDFEAAPGFFVVGDGAGMTRGLLQSSCSGIVAAEAVARKLKK